MPNVGPLNFSEVRYSLMWLSSEPVGHLRAVARRNSSDLPHRQERELLAGDRLFSENSVQPDSATGWLWSSWTCWIAGCCKRSLYLACFFPSGQIVHSGQLCHFRRWPTLPKMPTGRSGHVRCVEVIFWHNDKSQDQQLWSSHREGDRFMPFMACPEVHSEGTPCSACFRLAELSELSSRLESHRIMQIIAE